MNRILAILFACVSLLPSFASAEAQEIDSWSLSLLPRGTIDTTKTGVNAFVNDGRFGSVRAQLNEVRNTLRLRHVRVLFAWSNEVQPSPSSRRDLSFYDDIARNIPAGSNALVILTGIPNWMSDSGNWIDGDPRKTFIERWAKPVMRRYRRNRRIVGWQFWNEPNDSGNEDNLAMGFADSPENYLSFLQSAGTHSRRLARGKKRVSAATTAIAQNYPETLEYNQALLAGGIQGMVDVFGVHYYGDHLERLLLGGVLEFMQSIQKPIWMTESGERGTIGQLDYVSRLWPYLAEEVPNIKRFYQYQFTEATPADTTYGLKNLTPGRTVSDLYIYLRDR